MFLKGYEQKQSGEKRFSSKIKKAVSAVLLFALLVSTAGCSATFSTNGNAAPAEPASEAEQSADENKEMKQEAESGDLNGEVKTLTRKSLISGTDDESSIRNLKPSVPEIKIADDMSNIINFDEYSYNDEKMLKMLKDNGFVVVDGAGREFFEIYENNRYFQTPNFVTVDSMMHTYHVYFAYLMRDIEKNHLYDDLSDLTADMLNESYDQYKELKGTEWEDAAKRNVALFSVAAVLLDESAKVPSVVKDTVKTEYDHIMKAEGIDTSAVTEDFEDYSQYKPRGYYEGDKTLEKYFRAMMWYGRIQYTQEFEDLDRSALLETLALDNGHYDKWSSIYAVTAFFAGASDDLGYCEYMPVIEKAYGKGAGISDLPGNDKAWKEFHSLTAKLRAPRINSIPIGDTEENKDEDNVIPGYRFMGQRFTIDATIMQELVYRRVGEFEDEDKRMLPDFLDVPAALGSEKAYSLLKDMGATKYKNYDRNLENMREEFNNEDSSLWNASLYASWLNTLRPLLEEKGKGYPFFMQNDEWTKKDLETFAGSYTELKHDTVLYAKQMMAEMGGGWEEDKDFRGYVEPEPLVFARFEKLAESTAEGLDELGYLSDADEENLKRLAELAGKLKTISVKELSDEKLDDDEYELIEIYGGEIEHFWMDAMKAQTGNEYPTSDDYPAAIVVDVATDPNGTILEMATGDPAVIYVVVPVDGKLRIAEGCVYSFYQFEQPLSDRLTDTQWRKMMGIEMDNYESYNDYGKAVDHPDWTKSYRFFYR
ncbi:MAG: DUF3160 domain-containing protein [Lachnospiraceae bacterium]|nr:DUF3160 domain-containing protein [Lachnospiraceae bacterium]